MPTQSARPAPGASLARAPSDCKVRGAGGGGGTWSPELAREVAGGRGRALVEAGGGAAAAAASPAGFLPSPLSLLLFFLLYESGISRGIGAATRGPGARSCSGGGGGGSWGGGGGAATAAATRSPGAQRSWRRRPRAQTAAAAGAATAAAGAAAAPPRRAPRPPAPWLAEGWPAALGPRDWAAGAAAAVPARWPLARPEEAAAGGSRRSRACSANTPTSSRAGKTGKESAARAPACVVWNVAPPAAGDCLDTSSFPAPWRAPQRREGGRNPGFPRVLKAGRIWSALGSSGVLPAEGFSHP